MKNLQNHQSGSADFNNPVVSARGFFRRNNLFRTIFGIFSLSGIMFTFQACYGTPQDFGLDLLVQGKVVSGSTKEGIQGIKVSVPSNGQYTETASDGTFMLYTERQPEYRISVTDTDGALNGVYQAKDTVITVPETIESIDLRIELN
ncbi:MAG TPA: hypothetical protein DC042_14445 [Bacteroidales bacterium]|nr:hypothetical protein [Bacteroidales bacterium]